VLEIAARHSTISSFLTSFQQAVETPRFATFSYPDSYFPHVEVDRRLSVEVRIPAAVGEELARRGHQMHERPPLEFDAGGVGLLVELESPDPDRRVFVAGADPRRSCYAQGR